MARRSYQNSSAKQQESASESPQRQDKAQQYSRPFPTQTAPQTDPVNAAPISYDRSCPSILPKLTVGAVGDKYEQEADAVASQVVQQLNSSPPPVQREDGEEDSLQRQPIAGVVQRVPGYGSIAAEEMARRTPMGPVFEENAGGFGPPNLGESIQRKRSREMENVAESLRNPPKGGANLMPVERVDVAAQLKEVNPWQSRVQDGFIRQGAYANQAEPHNPLFNPAKAIQRQGTVGAAGGGVSSDFERDLNAARGGGQSLAPDLQTQMGQAMGADFSGVKVHTDAQSDQLNQSIQAKAFTTGQDVFFRQGAYEPGSRGGQELIAHELTHVVQQNGGAVRRSPTPPHTLNPLSGGSDPLKSGLEHYARMDIDTIQARSNTAAIQRRPIQLPDKRIETEDEQLPQLQQRLAYWKEQTSGAEIVAELSAAIENKEFAAARGSQQRLRAGGGGRGPDVFAEEYKNIMPTVTKYMGGVQESMQRFAEITAEAKSVPIDRALIATGVARLGLGVANIATLGSASVATGIAGGLISAGEDVYKKKQDRETQGRDKMSAKQGGKKGGKAFGKQLVAGGTGYGAKAATTATVEALSLEAVGSSIPIAGGLIQIGLALRSLSKLEDRALAEGYSHRRADLIQIAHHTDGNLEALKKMLGSAAGHPRVIHDLSAIVAALSDLKQSLDIVMLKISKGMGRMEQYQAGEDGRAEDYQQRTVPQRPRGDAMDETPTRSRSTNVFTK